MQYQQLNTELEPLIRSGNSSGSGNGNSNNNRIVSNLQLDKLPSYNESAAHHLVISVNMPTPPSYQESIHVAGQQTQQQQQQQQTQQQVYPVVQVFAFGMCMLIGAGILYAFKHGI